MIFSKAPHPEILRDPPVPRPLHGLSPRKIMPHGWWQETRQKTIDQQGYICQATGEELEPSQAQCHEMYDYDFANGRATFIGTAILSIRAHQYFHLGRTWAAAIKRGHGWVDDDFVKAQQLGRDTLTSHVLTEHYSRVFIFARFLQYHSVPSSFNEFGLAAKLYDDALKIGQNHSDELVPWGDWRLNIGGRVYKPRDSGYDEYRKRNHRQ